MTAINASPDELYLAAAAADRLPYTGRQILTFAPDAQPGDVTAALRSLGPMAAASDFDNAAPKIESLEGAATLFFDHLGMAVLSPAAQLPVGVASVDGLVESVESISGIENETFLFVADAIDDARTAAAEAEDVVTWGLAATRVPLSHLSGHGIKIAILDTGLDLNHPDFAGRSITSETFVPGQPVQDLHGHGTHCTGTACGPLAPAGVPRYGVAHGASIFAGKVLSNSGIAVGGSVLAGINWAIAQRCDVISMSLAAPGNLNPTYEQAAQRALAAGCLVVAAAGNESVRPNRIAPTDVPANSPDMVSVAALDRRLAVAYFSNGGKIEIAGPGVDVFSALPRPRLHGMLSGTSQATPHVAGIAALLAESNPGLRGPALRTALLNRILRLPLPPSDIGFGLVQAP